MIKKQKQKKPNILFWDIETSLMKAYTFSLWPERISIDDVISDWRILCICYAWNDEPPQEITGTEKEIVRKFSKILNEADISVYHNGDKFDLKRLRSKIVEYGLPSIKQFNSANTVDTYKVVKKECNFSSNKLDFIARNVMKIGSKIVTNKKLWIDATEGCEDALARMVTYCKRDVVVLRNVYKRLRPYITNHPNMNHYSNGDSVCTNCGSSHIQKRGFRLTRVGRYQAYQCLDCTGYFQSGKNLQTTPTR